MPRLAIMSLTSGAPPNLAKLGAKAKRLILLGFRVPAFFFCHFLPKNRMSSPEAT
jgi:hypothetical protein